MILRDTYKERCEQLAKGTISAAVGLRTLEIISDHLPIVRALPREHHRLDPLLEGALAEEEGKRNSLLSFCKESEASVPSKCVKHHAPTELLFAHVLHARKHIEEAFAAGNWELAFIAALDFGYALGQLQERDASAAGGRRRKPPHPLERAAFEAWGRLRERRATDGKRTSNPKPSDVINEMNLHSPKEPKERQRARGKGELGAGSLRNLVRGWIKIWRGGVWPRGGISHG